MSCKNPRGQGTRSSDGGWAILSVSGVWLILGDQRRGHAERRKLGHAL